MRHNKKFNHLGRKSAHRKALLSNMACSLILHKRITTTTAKAKEIKTFVEPLITRSKDDSTHNRRVVFSMIKSKTAVSELFREISPKIADRPGGYCRILKTGSRLGDNAEMCILELVDYNENMLATKDDKKASSRRRRAGKKKEEAPVAKAAVAAPVVNEAAKETVVEEAVEEQPIADVAEVVEDVVADTTEEPSEPAQESGTEEVKE
jgi:large subunit ribosomal protein L17